MKLGVITDIHNNLPALQAVVERLNQLKCDKIICCGDMIGIGPYPEETVQMMRRIPNLMAVRGNHEKYLLEGMPDTYPNEEQMDYEEMKHHHWEHGLLSAESIDFLQKLPYRIDTLCEGRRLSILHYCMDADGHYIRYTPNPSEEDLQRMFADVKSDIILYGHDHRRNICTGDKLYVNAGSLGCPAREQNIARACIVKIEKESVEAQPIDIEYDADTVVRAIDRIHYPAADDIKRFFYGVGQG